MLRRTLYCEACGCETEHLIEENDDDGEMLALCSRCGRLQSVPCHSGSSPCAARPGNSRTR
ncbi:MAG: hypothetical protein ACM3Q1_15215 [Bacteroidales bacterium]